MKKILGLAFGVMAFSTSHAIVVNFDDLVGDNIAVPLNYSGIADMSNWTYYNFDQPPYNPSSGTCRVYNIGNSNITMGQDVIFGGAFFNGYGTANGFSPISFEMYDNGNLVATSGSIDLAGNGTGQFLASGYNGVVDQVKVLGTSGFYIMDDFTYDVVPEPASMLVLGGGLVAILRRRKK
ncbi:MAG: PEP-CTERM sorting domain-containing protein [Chthonomonadaceae bacterium]|nr:PEP-CTERM sorting domain-containing protein [Chthonomonadaceae bacterium]